PKTNGAVKVTVPVWPSPPKVRFPAASTDSKPLKPGTSTLTLPNWLLPTLTCMRQPATAIKKFEPLPLTSPEFSVPSTLKLPVNVPGRPSKPGSLIVRLSKKNTVLKVPSRLSVGDDEPITGLLLTDADEAARSLPSSANATPLVPFAVPMRGSTKPCDAL